MPRRSGCSVRRRSSATGPPGWGAGAPVVTYINTTAEVKAESDVIVTSANAEKILRKVYEKHPKVIFIPDEWMGRNLARIPDRPAAPGDELPADLVTKAASDELREPRSRYRARKAIAAKPKRRR